MTRLPGYATGEDSPQQFVAVVRDVLGNDITSVVASKIVWRLAGDQLADVSPTGLVSF